MAFTIVIGTWIYPLALTLAAAAWALWERPSEYMGFMPVRAFNVMVRLGVGAIASLAAWLAWSFFG